MLVSGGVRAVVVVFVSGGVGAFKADQSDRPRTCLGRQKMAEVGMVGAGCSSGCSSA